MEVAGVAWIPVGDDRDTDQNALGEFRADDEACGSDDTDTTSYS